MTDLEMNRVESKSSGLDSGADTLSNSDASSEKSTGLKSNEDSNSITIIGSGDFGRALALRMVQKGYTVLIGSRNPERHRALVEKVGAKILKTEDALKASQIVVLAVPKDFYEKQPLHLFEGKTVIDVSNRSTIYRKEEQSQAEYLQSLLPRSAVIKAFNVLSAYALETGGIQGSKEVLYAGDVHSAKEDVNNIIRTLGFVPVDRGALRNSREIEDIPVQRFPLWKKPMIVSLILFGIFFILGFTKYQVCWTLSWDAKWNMTNWHWGRFETIPVTTVNSVLAIHALNMLALCYLPGCIAGFIQIFRGTKYSRFPNFLDQWLKMRKQLGLLMLFSASIHMCMSVALLSPTQYELAYKDPPKDWNEPQSDEVPKMKIRGEVFLAAGVTSYAFAVILGITSLPSVTNVLTWKEFAFVQSKLGWFCLLMGCIHDMAYGWPYLNFGNESCGVPSSFNYALYIPFVTICLKFILLIPPIDWHLTKIRGGYERGPLPCLGRRQGSDRYDLERAEVVTVSTTKTGEPQPLYPRLTPVQTA